MLTNEDLVTVVAISTLILAYGSQRLTSKKGRERKVWVKKWLMERELRGAYNALLVDLPRTAMDDYKRFMRMDEDTFKVKFVFLFYFLLRRYQIVINL